MVLDEPWFRLPMHRDAHRVAPLAEDPIALNEMARYFPRAMVPGAGRARRACRGSRATGRLGRAADGGQGEILQQTQVAAGHARTIGRTTVEESRQSCPKEQRTGSGSD